MQLTHRYRGTRELILVYVSSQIGNGVQSSSMEDEMNACQSIATIFHMETDPSSNVLIHWEQNWIGSSFC